MRLTTLYVVALLLLPHLKARAGDYYLEDVKLFLPVRIKPLLSAGIKTTKQLRQLTSSKGQIRALSKKTHISPARLKKVHEFCRFLLIPGIGPKMTRAFNLIGVDTVEALAASNAGVLDQKLKEMNKRRHVLGKLPGKDLLEYWVNEAKKLSRTHGRSGPQASPRRPVQ